MQQNVAIFSAAKTWQQASELASLVVNDKGQQREWKSFKEEALKVAADYNVHYLRTEYDTAVAAGQMAGLWKQMEATVGPDALAMYDTVGDARVRPEHQKWDRIIRPLSDDFWNTHWPPNGYNCRCTVRFVNDGEVTENVPGPDDADVPPVFRFNSGKMGMIFSPEHPYWEIPADKLEAVSKVLGKSVEQLNADIEASHECRFMSSTIATETIPKITDEARSLKPKEMNEAEFVAIMAYTGSHYKKLNTELRGFGQALESDMTPEQVSMSRLMYSGLKKLPIYEGNCTRMTDKVEVEGWKVGNEVVVKQYYSVGMGEKPSTFLNKKVVITIESKSSKILNKMSQYPDEKEVIFVPGTRLKVVRVDEESIEGQTITFVKLQEV